MIVPIAWSRGAVAVLDQRLLPSRRRLLRCRRVEDLARAIEGLAVRGAPLIGIAAAYGMALGVSRSDPASLERDFQRSRERLSRTRPTAVNLFWALGLMERAFRRAAARGPGPVRRALLAEARSIHRQDALTCAAIGRHGARLLARGARVLTHCNAGMLATGGIGTALGIVYTAHRQGRIAMVYADETRPLLQGSRLTAWELRQGGVPVTVICDNMAGALMARGGVDAVLVGADRIAADGDCANKTGSYGLAVLARAHRIPFYVAAPSSTIDLDARTGGDIPIEQRRGDEIIRIRGTRIAPCGIACFNPSFDVVPHRLVTAIITEHGVIERPNRRKILHVKNLIKYVKVNC
ncbi:MAG: S-methyl-5-thioribose-1-phosphate isomerase [Candidatus Edwardsbacteria bacterium]|nr:S-methyl-5-thioribose-1-phosphate isomerase [Candidatus Edwardsbacteria bacterium]